MATLEKIKREYEDILSQLSDPGLISNWEKLEKLSKKKNYFEKLIEKEEEIKEIKNQIEENKEILSAEKDPELLSLAETESETLYDRKIKAEQDLENLLKEASPQNLKKEETASVIVEIRAGVGGEEASLFCGDIFRMYSKYANLQHWSQKILNSHPTGLGGFKEIIFELNPLPQSKSKNVYSKMKYEAGVHRVQRIPITEKGGRIHTSTVTVAILPKPKKTQIKIKSDDLKIDFYRASGPGGQYVNRRETAVRITHLPTGIVVTSQTERNQLQNKENALSILEARILEKKETEEIVKASLKRKTQIGWAKRAEKIRTYNFPQDRVTDHRIKKSWHHIEEIMSGNLDSIIKTLEKKLE